MTMQLMVRNHWRPLNTGFARETETVLYNSLRRAVVCDVCVYKMRVCERYEVLGQHTPCGELN